MHLEVDAAPSDVPSGDGMPPAQKCVTIEHFCYCNESLRIVAAMARILVGNIASSLRNVRR
jgi:hypothetical protein